MMLESLTCFLVELVIGWSGKQPVPPWGARSATSMMEVMVLLLRRVLSRDMLCRLRVCELLPGRDPGEDARLAFAVLATSDIVSLLLPRFSRNAAMSLDFRALTRS